MRIQVPGFRLLIVSLILTFMQFEVIARVAPLRLIAVGSDDMAHRSLRTSSSLCTGQSACTKEEWRDLFILPIDSEQIPEEGSRVPAVVPSQSKRLNAAFGAETLDVSPGSGTEVSGWGRSRRSTTSSTSSPETPVWAIRCEMRWLDVRWSELQVTRVPMVVRWCFQVMWRSEESHTAAVSDAQIDESNRWRGVS